MVKSFMNKQKTSVYGYFFSIFILDVCGSFGAPHATQAVVCCAANKMPQLPQA